MKECAVEFESEANAPRMDVVKARILNQGSCKEHTCQVLE